MYYGSNYGEIRDLIDEAKGVVDAAAAALGSDPDLVEISSLLSDYRSTFE